MKLSKALKLRKNLIGEIAKLKKQINDKNSYLEGSKNGEKFNVNENYELLLSKINELTGLKFAINEANREIQSKIYVLGEHKALIAFWNNVSVVEGTQVSYGDKVQNYIAQFDEEKRNEIVNKFQKKVDVIQENLDTFNFTTDIPWGDEEIESIDDEDLNDTKWNNPETLEEKK